MAEIAIHVPRPHPGQRRMLDNARRFNIACMGRRYGKTVFGSLHIAMRDALAGKRVGWFAPHYKYLQEPWDEITLRAGPIARQIDKQQKRVRLLTGGLMDFWSLEDPHAGRSRRYDTAIIDEAAMARNLRKAWTAAIRPTLTDTQGGAWFLSTPLGRNYFHELWTQAQDDEEWATFRAPTAENPHIAPAEIEAARKSLPERVFRQEYLAEFIEDGAGVFRGVTEAARLQPAKAIAGLQYTIGVDWGRSNDYTVFSVLENGSNKQRHIERFTGIGYELQTRRLTELLARYPGQILAEANAMGGPLIEKLQAQGLPIYAFHTTHASKQQIIDELSLAIETGRVELLDDETQTGELLAYEITRLPGGGLRYAAPEGMHDDTVIALALAWHGAQFNQTVPDYSRGGIHSDYRTAI